MSSKKYLLPLLTLIVIILSLAAEHFDAGLITGRQQKPGKKQSIAKLNEVIQYIETFYVDDVDWDETIAGAIEGTLESLDPHSVYITPEDATRNEENFQGKYQGIGIHFDVIDGYLTVIAVIPGSPSEKAGLQPSDKIIKINNKAAYNIGMLEVPKKLKGPKGTSVDVSIIRSGFDEPIEITIIRDEIPIYTINTFFMADEKKGYIWLSRFASTTADELENALIDLERRGMERLILDLRGNGGGYLRQAVKVVGKFIYGHKKVVYTQGRLSKFDDDFFTDDFGRSIKRDYPMIVLIDHGSASASEIVAGAIQDYDRGLVIGTNSFGKGLVQNEFELNDNSRLRLTVSKYYTPSGRLIQKAYKGKDRLDYYYSNGNEENSQDSLETEAAYKDSINERPVFYTQGNRKVYGGGGITPDIEVKYESFSKSPKLTQQLLQKRIYFETASNFVDRSFLGKEDFQRFLLEFKVNDRLLKKLYNTAKKRDINFTKDEFEKDIPYLKNRLKAVIARNVWDMSKYYQVLLQHDNQFKKALELFPEAVSVNNKQTVKIN